MPELPPSPVPELRPLNAADGPYTYGMFIHELKDGPEAVWKHLAEIYNDVMDQLENIEEIAMGHELRANKLEEKVQNARTALKAKDQQINDLIEEREAEKVAHQATKDELLQALRQQTRSPATAPLAERGASEKGIKIPDPPVFEGKTSASSDIESWFVKMRGKLAANAWLFPNEQIRVQYVLSRVGDKAYKHLEPRLSGPTAFSSAEEIFEYLARIYVDPGRKRKARDEFRRLRQARTPFNDFWAEFQRLALEIGKSEDDQLEELQDKLSDELKTVLAAQIPTDLYKFVSPRDSCIQEKHWTG
jgi:hypothetical protein